jgi:hypothetical protein
MFGEEATVLFLTCKVLWEEVRYRGVVQVMLRDYWLCWERVIVVAKEMVQRAMLLSFVICSPLGFPSSFPVHV